MEARRCDPQPHELRVSEVHVRECSTALSKSMEKRHFQEMALGFHFVDTLLYGLPPKPAANAKGPI